MSQAPVASQINNIAQPDAENANAVERSHVSERAQSRFVPLPQGESETSHKRSRSRETDKHDEYHRRSSSGRRHRSSAYERSPSPKRHKGHKPAQPTVLKGDGSNYPIWLLRIKIDFRHAGIEHVLDKPRRGEEYSPRHLQHGMDILLDRVEDSLGFQVVKPHKSKAITPYKVMKELHQLFGQGNTAMHSILRAEMMGLKQAADEKVTPYFQRGEKIYGNLKLAGGRMSSKTFLQCLKEGVLDKFSITIELFEMRKEQTAAILRSLLQAQECKLARREGLRGDHTAPQQAAMVVNNHGDTQQWTHWREPNGAAAKPVTCWNCGGQGHRVKECSKPIIKPLKFKPADFQYRSFSKRSKQAGPAQVTA